MIGYFNCPRTGVRLNSSRNCSVCVGMNFDEMESSFARFYHVCF